MLRALSFIASVAALFTIPACGGSDPSHASESDSGPPPTGDAALADNVAVGAAEGGARAPADASATMDGAGPGACGPDPAHDSTCERLPFALPSPHYFTCAAPAGAGAACTNIATLFGAKDGGASTTFWCCP